MPVLQRPRPAVPVRRWLNHGAPTEDDELKDVASLEDVARLLPPRVFIVATVLILIAFFCFTQHCYNGFYTVSLFGHGRLL